MGASHAASRIRVLVVDDSAFARKVVREVLSSDAGIEVVGFARDGLDALEKVSELKPDVVTLDLVMPDLDGLGFLRALPLCGRPKVIVVTASGAETDLVLEALQLGAIDMIHKPTPLPTDRLYELSQELVAKVHAAAAARPRATAKEAPAARASVPAEAASTPAPPSSAPVARSAASTRLVVIGTSTGGPQALTQLFAQLPRDLPVPFAIALHIPAGYTAPLAARISAHSGVPIEEARDGMELVRGHGVIAPGGMHLRLRASGDRIFAMVGPEPRELVFHPSVDELFTSAAQAAGPGALGVVLTGMGVDGTLGSQSIRSAGGRVLTESEPSCVVYGMPRSAVEAGTSNAQAPLESMGSLLLSYIYD